jgi:glycosyltransferase involved in cell wall biosynthesis
VENGAKLTILGGDETAPNRAVKFKGKLSILFSMLSPKLIKLRKMWAGDDHVLVIGWQALPILALVRLGILHCPKKMTVMACFVHNQLVRSFVNTALKVLAFDRLAFIVFSRGEAENLVKQVGLSGSMVYVHLWRQNLYGRVNPEEVISEDYIFSGGYSNRDYELLIDAVKELDQKLVIVASSRNSITVTDESKVIIHRDLDESSFEELLAHSRLVVISLRSGGEACGQSVLLRVLRNGKPLIVTRHESIEDYLGHDFSGFVEPGDVEAMRYAIWRSLNDTEFCRQLVDEVKRSNAMVERQENPGDEIQRFVIA